MLDFVKEVTEIYNQRAAFEAHKILNAKYLKKIFMTLAKMRKPTGVSTCPTAVTRAHQIEELIDEKCDLDAPGDEENDDTDTENEEEEDTTIQDKTQHALSTPDQRNTCPTVNCLGTPREAILSQNKRRDMIFDKLSNMIDSSFSTPGKSLTDSIEELSIMQFN
ncbi:hypothetical protein BJ508DRAFT_322040 [Ascobolus immersus RN42]|uniref:DUF6818 domain-containing protein n=1 Tax=Ascobolus immersus RN42 TaxID=1160509 RepID=A0A3N4IJS0_ASCIM|nr:hypothetical protein BJ508DRAFT_322040 [Ascobolus immersus RN42]